MRRGCGRGGGEKGEGRFAPSYRPTVTVAESFDCVGLWGNDDGFGQARSKRQRLDCTQARATLGRVRTYRVIRNHSLSEPASFTSRYEKKRKKNVEDLTSELCATERRVLPADFLIVNFNLT